MKKFIVLCLGMLFLFSGLACSSGSQTSSTTTDSSDQSKVEQQQQNSSTTGNTADETKNSEVTSQTSQEKPKIPAETEKSKKNPIVTIEMEDGQKITVELYPDIAPNTVKNFISLVKNGYYNGLIFHRVIPGFMIQGGSQDGTGSGGPGYSIKGEFSSNGFVNNLKHERGVISMARTNIPDSAGSQFFIMVEVVSRLDAEYAAFGKVLTGMEEADKIVNVQRDPNDKPLTPQKMKKVTVDTFGVDYGEPEKAGQ